MSNLILTIILIFLIGAIILLFIGIMVFIDVRNGLDTLIRNRDDFNDEMYKRIQSVQSNLDDHIQLQYDRENNIFEVIDTFEGIPVIDLPFTTWEATNTLPFIPLIPDIATATSIIKEPVCLDWINFGEEDKCRLWSE